METVSRILLYHQKRHQNGSRSLKYSILKHPATNAGKPLPGDLVFICFSGIPGT